MLSGFRFLIDESTIWADVETDSGDPAALAALAAVALTDNLERLVESIQVVSGHSVGKTSDIWSRRCGEHELAEWLFDPSLGVDQVVSQALQAALSRMPDWDDTIERAGLNGEVTIDGLTETSISVEAALRSAVASVGIACLSASPKRRGTRSVLAEKDSADVHFILDESDMFGFFRSLPELEDHDEVAYFVNADFAFPNLHFVRGKTNFRRFDESYRTIRPKVTLHLAVLNDHAKSILETSEVASEKEARLGAFGVTASGENSNTKKNKKAMGEREVQVEGRTVVCDWHTKLQPHIDRIYFNATSQRSVVIGIFSSHLS